MEEYKPLPNRFNLGERKNIIKDIIPDLSDDYFTEEWKHPVIIHFSPNKPWRTQSSYFNGRTSKYFNEWWLYASMTPYIEGLKNCFIASRISDGFKGLKTGTDDYGNNQMDTLRSDHPWQGLQGHDGNATTQAFRNLQKGIHSTSEFRANSSFTKYYKLLGLPLIKIQTDKKGNRRLKLFNLLPVLKIEHDSKGGKTYKLFSLLPLLKIKSK